MAISSHGVAGITNFAVGRAAGSESGTETGEVVSWEYEGRQIVFRFEHRVAAYHIEYLNEVLIQAWVNDYPQANLFIYHADGRLKAQPAMPKRPHEVGGVYSVWFEQGKRHVTVVLHSEEFSPYDTACTFDLESHEFSKFHPTK